MTLGVTYGIASGVSSASASVIGYRFDADVGFHPERGESYLVEVDGDKVHSLIRGEWFRGLWRSAAGKVYVASNEGAMMHASIGGPDAPWHRIRIGFTPEGVYGLDDECVFVWGRQGRSPRWARWDGRRWTELPMPSVPLTSLHAVSEDLVVGVGDGGYIGHWDGSQWNESPLPAAGALLDVCVVSEQEVYAVSGMTVFKGSVDGWSELQACEQLASVAHWRGDLYVGTMGELGLCRWQDGELVSIKANVQTFHMEARENLLMSMESVVVSTVDGANYRGSKVAYFEGLVAHNTPLWKES